MKYIDADKLKAEIKIIQQSLEHRDVRFNQVKKIRTECMMEFCKCIFDVITSLQQEQPEVDLEEEINKFFENVGMPVYWCNDAEQQEFCSNVAHHFYELGFNARGK